MIKISVYYDSICVFETDSDKDQLSERAVYEYLNLLGVFVSTLQTYQVYVDGDLFMYVGYSEKRKAFSFISSSLVYSHDLKN